MSVGSLVLVFTSIDDTVPLSLSVTKRVLPSGVTTDTLGFEPTAMSGSLVLVPTSITDTVPPSQFGTKAVARHGAGAGIADAPTGNMPTSAPDHPSTKNRRTHRIPASCPESHQLRSAGGVRVCRIRACNQEDRTSAKAASLRSADPGIDD